jgi:hypothetical protein
MTFRAVSLISTLLVTMGGVVQANDYFVVTDTFKTQQEAQDRAAANGGWALDTDAYSALEPDRFAVVRGPFSTRQVASEELAQLKKLKTYRSAYVKDAGSSRLPGQLGSASPRILAALLGELSIAVKDMPGKGNPCEPEEPYQDVSISVVTLDRTGDSQSLAEGFKPRRVSLDIGGFWVIRRTGEVQRMRICAE